MPRFLIDLSAWARSGHAHTRERWAALLQGDQLPCPPIFALQLLYNAVDPADYRRLREDLDKGFDWVWLVGQTAESHVSARRRRPGRRGAGGSRRRQAG